MVEIVGGKGRLMTLEICSEGHLPIVFDNGLVRSPCPLCAAIKRADGAESEVKQVRGWWRDSEDKVRKLSAVDHARRIGAI